MQTASPKSPAPPPSDAAEPLLDLDTLVTRPAITIDGQRYDILSPNEISVIESHRFGIWGKRIEALAGATGDEAEKELAALIDTVARAVSVGVPEAVFETLSGSHKWAIVDVFTGLLLRNRLGVAGAIAKAAGVEWPKGLLPIGAISSPGSSASTAATRPGGWLRRLWPW